MSRKGIQETFWRNALMKASMGRASSSTSTQNSQAFRPQGHASTSTQNSQAFRPQGHASTSTQNTQAFRPQGHASTSTQNTQAFRPQGHASTSTQNSQAFRPQGHASTSTQNTQAFRPQGHASASTQNTQAFCPPETTIDKPRETGPPANTQRRPTTSGVQEKSPKRLKTVECTLEDTPKFQPPENPCFVSSADVGRTWHWVRRNNKRHKNRSVPFRIVSYNVLADVLLNSHPMLYENCPAWCLEWEYRKKNLLKEILQYNADILCLQEVEEQHYESWFKPELQKAGYQGIYKKRTGEKVDGCATFYKGSMFRIVTHRFFNYKLENVPLMDRDNVALLVLLHPRYGDDGTCYNTALCVVNTHLLFNKNRGDIKLLQLACLFAEIDQFKKEFLCEKGVHKAKIKKIPVVLTGDFNTTPFCPLYHFIVEGYLNYKGISKGALSGQNSTCHPSYYRDPIQSNIVPVQLGLSYLSVWDKKPVLAQVRKATTPCSNFVKDDFGSLNSDQQEYNSNFDLQKSGPSTSVSIMPQQGDIQPLLPDYNLNAYTSHTCNASYGQQAPKESTEAHYNPSCTVIKHNLHFYSVYRHYLEDRVREVSTYHEKESSCTVDFFFVSPGKYYVCESCLKQHTVMELMGYLNLLSEQNVSSLGGLPNKKLSSDHLALVADFVLHV